MLKAAYDVVIKWRLVCIFGSEGRPAFYGNSKFGTCQPMELAVILALIKCEIATALCLL